MTDAACKHAEFYFHHGYHWTLAGAYAIPFTVHLRTGIVAKKSFVFSTGVANEFAETDTKLVPVCRSICRSIAGADAGRRHRLSTYRCLPPRNPCGVFVEQERRDETSQSVFSLPTTQEDSRFACVKAIPRREALRAVKERKRRNALYIPRFFSLTWALVSETRS